MREELEGIKPTQDRETPKPNINLNSFIQKNENTVTDRRIHMQLLTPSSELNSQYHPIPSIRNCIVLMGHLSRPLQSSYQVGHWKKEEIESDRSKRFAGVKL